MSLIPPPTDEESARFKDSPGLSRHDSSEDDAPAAMTLGAIGKGGDGGPLGLDGFGDDEASSTGDLSRLTQHSAFAIVIVAAVAVVVLVAMRMTAGSMDAETDSQVQGVIDQYMTQIEVNPEQAASLTRDDTAIAIILTGTGQAQPHVPIEYVQKNPFELGIKRPEKVVVKPKDGITEKERAQRIKANMSRAIRDLSIDMIMDGSEDKAVVINGDILKIGDTVSIFRIESIEPQMIYLRHDKYRVPLKVGD